MRSMWWIVILNCVLYTMESVCFFPDLQHIGLLKLGQVNLYPLWSTRWCDEVMLCGRAPLSLRMFTVESTYDKSFSYVQQQSSINVWILTLSTTEPPKTPINQTFVKALKDYIHENNQTALDFTNTTIPEGDHGWCSLVADVLYPLDSEVDSAETLPTYVDYVLSVVNETELKTVTIVYDSLTEAEVFYLTEGLYKQEALYMLLDRTTMYMGDARKFWKHNRLSFDEFTTVLVWCSITCMEKVFEELALQSRGSAHDIASLHMLRLLVVFPSNESVSLPSQYSQANLFKFLSGNLSSQLHLHGDLSSDFRDEDVDDVEIYNDTSIVKAVENMATALRDFYHVAVLWQYQNCLRLQTFTVTADGGRELYYAGFGDNRGNVVTRAPVFPNTKWQFNHQKFIIGTEVWAPFVTVKTDNKGQKVYSGLCIDMLKAMARSLNFTYELRQPADGQFGVLENGSWTGLIKMLVDKEVHMVVAPLGIDDLRVRVVDFSMPFFQDYTAVLFKRPDTDAYKLKTYLMPFDWKVFLVIGVAFVLASLFGHMVSVVSVGVVAYQAEPAGTLLDTFLYFFGSLLSQGGVWSPATGSVRLFLSAWWIFCVIVAAIYSGNLTASFAVTKDEPSFDTLQEMLEQGSYSFGAVPGTIWDNIFGTSNRTEFQRVHQEIAAFRRAHKNDGIELEENHVQRAKTDDTYAYISTLTSLTLTVRDNCDLMILDETFLPMQYAVALEKDSPLTDIVSQWVLKMNEGGLDKLWSSQWLNDQGKCEAASGRSGVKKLEVVDVQSAFYLLLIGIAVAVVAISVECVCYWRKKREEEGVGGRGGGGTGEERDVISRDITLRELSRDSLSRDSSWDVTSHITSRDITSRDILSNNFNRSSHRSRDTRSRDSRRLRDFPWGKRSHVTLPGGERHRQVTFSTSGYINEGFSNTNGDVRYSVSNGDADFDEVGFYVDAPPRRRSEYSEDITMAEEYM